ncbi:response regulator transcription factor [Sorangium cellulosum]
MLTLGHSDKDIANTLAMSLPTVRTCVARIYKKLGVHGRAELVARAHGAR